MADIKKLATENGGAELMTAYIVRETGCNEELAEIYAYRMMSMIDPMLHEELGKAVDPCDGCPLCIGSDCPVIMEELDR